MQTANILLAIGGDRGNTVPKTRVSAAEIALLRAIHGDEAVFDVEPLTLPAVDEEGEVLTNRDELQRLKRVYQAAKIDGKQVVEMLYPGAAARVFETLSELGLPEEYFKPVAHAKAIQGTQATRANGKVRGKAKADEPTDAGGLGDGLDDDGIGEMPSVMG